MATLLALPVAHRAIAHHFRMCIHINISICIANCVRISLLLLFLWCDNPRGDCRVFTHWWHTTNHRWRERICFASIVALIDMCLGPRLGVRDTQHIALRTNLASALICGFATPIDLNHSDIIASATMGLSCGMDAWNQQNQYHLCGLVAK